MLAEDYMSDEYVASLLKRNARIARSNTQRWACKICSLRGMCFDDFLYLLELYSPYMLLRPTTNAPKPNTRFLKNVIRETDSHNAALRAKETEESKVRLRKLKARSLHNGERGTRRAEPG
jgi:hypothetical protein